MPRPADWRAASFLLERGWPLEFGAVEDRPLPVEPGDEPKKKKEISWALVINTNGQSLKEMVDFPIRDKYEPPEDGELINGPDDLGNGNGPRFNP